jgi:hypothetical protein
MCSPGCLIPCAVAIALLAMVIPPGLYLLSDGPAGYELFYNMMSSFTPKGPVMPYKLPTPDSELVKEINAAINSGGVTKPTMHSMWISPILHFNIKNLNIKGLDTAQFNANLFTAIMHEYSTFVDVSGWLISS